MHGLKVLFLTVFTASLLHATSVAVAQSSRTNAYLATLARAEASTRARDWAEAAVLWQNVIEENPVDGRFWFELGNARSNAGEHRKAISAYEMAVELRWGIPENTAYSIASTYALLGEKELALQWLDRAFRMGYRHVDRARRDDNLAQLRSDERFRAIVSLPNTSRMSRDEGLRCCQMSGLWETYWEARSAG